MQLSFSIASALLASMAAAAPLTVPTEKVAVPFPESAVNQIVDLGESNVPFFVQNDGKVTLFLVNSSAVENLPASKRELGESSLKYDFDASKYMKRDDFDLQDLVPSSAVVKRDAKKKPKFLRYWFFQPILKRGEEEEADALMERDAKKKPKWLRYWYFQPILKREEGEEAGVLEERDAKKKPKWLRYWYFQPILKREESEQSGALEERDAKKKPKWLRYWFFQPIL